MQVLVGLLWRRLLRSDRFSLGLGQGHKGWHGLRLVQQPAGPQQPAVAAGGRPLAHRFKIGTVQGAGRMAGHEAHAATGQLGLQPFEPLAHRGGRRQRLTCALVAAAPADQQVIARREQGLEQHVAILIGGVGIPQTPLLLEQVKTGALALPREDTRIQTQQHDHPVRDRPHRLEGADGQGATAMAEATRIGAQALVQHSRHHGGRELELTAGRCLLPVVNGGQQQRQLPGLIADGSPPLAKQIAQQGPQQLGPGRTAAGPAQLAKPVAQPPQQVQPTAQQLELLPERLGGCIARSQTGLGGQHQTQQQPVTGPGQAATGATAALARVEPPAKPELLQPMVEVLDLAAVKTKGLRQAGPLEQLLERRGCEPLTGQPQQLQQGAAQIGLALLAAVGEPPGEAHTGGVLIPEHRSQQRRQGIDLGCHHQHIPRLEAGVGRQQLQHPIAHDLDLPQPSRAGMKFERGIAGSPLQHRGLVRIGQLLLQLGQQGGRSSGAVHRSGGKKQIMLSADTQLGLAGALEQLLKFSPQPPEARIQPRGSQQPVAGKGLLQGHRIAELPAPVGAALPQVTARGQQIEIHRHMGAEGLQQLHLDRRHGTQAEQAQALGQQPGRQAPLAQAGDGPLHPQPKRLDLQTLPQQAQQQRLPIALPVALAILALPPEGKLIRPVQGVVVQGISHGTPQLPPGQLQLVGGLAPLLQPVAQGRCLGVLHQLGQQLQHRPDQRTGPPRIAGIGLFIQQRRHQAPQLGAWKRESDVGGDAAKTDGQLLAQPPAGGPGVDHHVDLLKRARWLEAQLGGQQLGQQLGPVAPIDG